MPDSHVVALVFTLPGSMLPPAVQVGFLSSLASSLIPYYGDIPRGAVILGAAERYQPHTCTPMGTTGHDDAARYTRYTLACYLGYAEAMPHTADMILPYVAGGKSIILYRYDPSLAWTDTLDPVEQTPCWMRYPAIVTPL